ncbi:NIL domain-containing protein [Ammonifex thiophilus]|uniref:4Fe-4S dicluster domain-containing protein n=1 Tax=Ammonifex thiophilus TaxID=444093 RepID=A0A3D8P3Z3_9THEO|nr:NIL domain-containing protein [Ammonifex thiophilus]RDV81766.1 4Fe-4S dicluster domain-containing protein [Ammonifex thiophilus]
MPPSKVVLRFPAAIADKPIIYRLVKDYDLMINILKANINPHKEGMMVLEVTGEKVEDGLDYLRRQGVAVQPLTEEIIRNEERCTHCGACTAICPTGALYFERPSMLVRFDGEACVVCQLCVRACPMKAMEVRF